MLDAYLKNPAPDVLLVLVAPAGHEGRQGTRRQDDRGRIRAAQRQPDSQVDHVLRRARSRVVRSPRARCDCFRRRSGTELRAAADRARQADRASPAAGRSTKRRSQRSSVCAPARRWAIFSTPSRDARPRAAIAMLGPGAASSQSRTAVTMVMALTAQTLCIGWAQPRANAAASVEDQRRSVQRAEDVGLGVHRTLVGRVRRDVCARVGAVVGTRDRRRARGAATRRTPRSRRRGCRRTNRCWPTSCSRCAARRRGSRAA